MLSSHRRRRLSPYSISPVENLPEYLRQRNDGVELRVLVVPNSSRNEIVGEHAGRLKLKVSAPPEQGRANEAVIELLRRQLKTKDISLIAGETSREKVLLIQGSDLASILTKLHL